MVVNDGAITRYWTHMPNIPNILYALHLDITYITLRITTVHISHSLTYSSTYIPTTHNPDTKPVL